MTKVKIAHGISDSSRRYVKNITRNKKKHRKFKKTPKGKIALANVSQAQSKGKPKNQKNGVQFQLQRESIKGDNKQSARSRVFTSEVKFPCFKIEPKDVFRFGFESEEVFLFGFDTRSSNGHINKEITIKEEVRAVEDKNSEEFHANGKAVDAVENIGVNMFESLKQEIKEEPSSDNAEDAVENKVIKMIGSLKQEIKEEPSSDDSDDAVDNNGINMIDSLKQEVKEEPSSCDDDDEEESEEDEEDEKPVLNLAALHGPSIADESIFEAAEKNWNDNDDEDDYITVVKSEDDYEMRAANEYDYESLILTHGPKRERWNRTIFITNVPPNSDVSAFWKKFRQFGIIESIRFRGPVNPNRTGLAIVPLHPKPSRKGVSILKTAPWKTDCYFITYKDEDSEKKAMSMNGKRWNGNILRVNTLLRKEKPNTTNAVSLGNLPPTIEENDLWELFEQCGQVKFVRIIRDRTTGFARGIGYIIFESEKEVALAIDLNGTMIGNTQLHVQIYTPKPKKKRKEKKKIKRSFSGKAGGALRKKKKIWDSQTVEVTGLKMRLRSQNENKVKQEKSAKKKK